MTKKEQMKANETKAVEAFLSLGIKAGDFIQVSYKSFWRIQGETTETEIWYADPCENNHYDRKLPFLEKLMFWNLTGGYQLLTSVEKYFNIKKVEATPELLERVETSKRISDGIHEAYNSGGQYKGD